ncbi:DUF1080 domain-containing protein [Verrucomicrobia bacterium]|nr:DUF1080 domain-containing protein [Verrucomicrobiota bacterium]
MKRPNQTLLVSAALALGIFSLTSCSTTPQLGKPMVVKSEPGFSSLFDGETLDGWKLIGGTGDGYTVEDGSIVCPQGGGGNLLTENQYANFILRLDFQLKPGSNNGIGIRAPMQIGSQAYEGMEIQTIDHTAEKYANLKPWQVHGSLYNIQPAKTGALNPVGEWNSQEITCDGRQIRVVLNGTTILDLDLNSITDTKTIFAHPGMFREKGHIGFLGHNDWVAYRNIRLKELPKLRVDNKAPAGFKALFNGKDLEGWQGLVENPKKRAEMDIDTWAEKQVDADDLALKNWRIVDGALSYIGKKFDNLCTSWDYGDFELSMDWKIYEGGDSGVYLRGSPQVQMWADPVGSGGLFNNKINASLPNVRADFFPGSWNRFHIVMVDDKVMVLLNGTAVTWDKKKRDGIIMENFWERDKAIYPFGSIELQAHKDVVQFKNIFLRSL